MCKIYTARRFTTKITGVQMFWLHRKKLITVFLFSSFDFSGLHGQVSDACFPAGVYIH